MFQFTPQIIMALIGAATAVAAMSEGDSTALDLNKLSSVKTKPNYAGMGFKSVTKKLTGPLPARALAALDAGKYVKGVNDIHKEGWFFYKDYSSDFQKKMDVLRFYSDPPGALFIRSYYNNFNIPWMARCPDKWYPTHAYKDRGIRMDAIKSVLGPKADWKTLTGGVKDVLATVPGMVESAMDVGAGVASGGASVAQDPQGQIEQVLDNVKDIFEALGGVVEGTKGRLRAAEALISGMGLEYQRAIARASPWLYMPDGNISVTGHYKANPRTYEDLFTYGHPDKAWPLIYNPAK